MTDLTEPEIFDCLFENAKKAAEHCDKLAWAPLRGPVYVQFREELKLVEGACRQAAAWRGDTRWLRIGLMMAEAHRRSGNWLRAYTSKDGRAAANPLFMKLAENLRALEKQAEGLKTQATGRASMTQGPILPAPIEGPHRDTRPVQVKTPGGLILPPGWREQGLRRRVA